MPVLLSALIRSFELSASDLQSGRKDTEHDRKTEGDRAHGVTAGSMNYSEPDAGARLRHIQRVIIGSLSSLLLAWGGSVCDGDVDRKLPLSEGEAALIGRALDCGAAALPEDVRGWIGWCV